MVTIFEDKTANDLIAMEAQGQIDKSDYDKFKPLLEKTLQQYGKARLYLEIKDIDMISLRALWEEVKVDMKHIHDFSKVAVVGDKAWKEMAAYAMKLLTTVDAKYFDFSEQQAAWEWVSQPV